MSSPFPTCEVCGEIGSGCVPIRAGAWKCKGAAPCSPKLWRLVTELPGSVRVYQPRTDRTDAPRGGSREAGPARISEPAPDFGGPILVCMADVQPQPIAWLWPNRIACGKLTLVAGDPGLGKSLATLDIAARVTTGTAWPDGATACEPGGVILLSAEDDPADTIRPRLDAAGADVSRTQLLRAVRRSEKSSESRFSLDGDLPMLEFAITRTPNAKLVIIDPISAYLGCRVDSYVNSEVRSLLAPLAELAGRTGVAIVLVTHLSKGGGGKAVYRAMGSLAFAAAARCVWLFAADRQDAKRRLFLSAKSNIAPDTPGMAYTIENGEGGPVVAWSAEPVTITADEALADPSGFGGDPSSLDSAKEWLRDSLAAGPMPADDVQAGAKAEGISRRTLSRAKSELGVKSIRQGYGQGSRWVWSLPGGVDAESAAAGAEVPKDAKPP